MTKIGILGGTRFIGFHLVKAALQKGWSVSIFNRGITKPPEKLPKEVEQFHGNRNNGRGLKNFFKNDYDAVIDLSGHTPAHVKPIVELFRKKIGHYIFCSTSYVYQTPPPVPIDENSPRTFAPGTYGGDKALAEELIFDIAKKENWPVTVFRLQGVFGEYDAGAQASYVFRRLKNNLPVILMTKGDILFNPLYVSDLVDAFVKAANNEISYGKVYTIAGDDAVYMIDFVKRCKKIVGTELRTKIVMESSYLGTKIGVPWPDYSLVLNNNAVKNDLGINFTPLDDALSQTWKWLCENPKYLRPIVEREEKYVLQNKPISNFRRKLWRIGDKIKRPFSFLMRRF
ncbi:TPA: NAD-dependent epimerase/dehydratase family protein [archaeon]|uniref:NAD-dependent epimerase/dehydratase family protein n=1 Tax=Candidatus Naiadarchaeum limnaeum TaxID=2756139 RepID=A0A832VB51_9ARCH|nr:NAD-dependent epimerase/dehydratase family protein [Candidatus Naiadarchaeum limnaeum]